MVLDFAELCNGSTAVSDTVCQGSNPCSAARQTAGNSEGIARRFLSRENPRLCRGFWKSFSDPYERKTPFGKMKVRPDNCTEIPKGGHSDDE